MTTTLEDRPTTRTRLPFELDDGIAGRARIGLVVLATDHTIEHEWRRILGGIEGVGLYQSRIWNDARITPETLAAMEAGLIRATLWSSSSLKEPNTGTSKPRASM